MAGATQLARPKHSAKRLNAFACCDFCVTSPTYVFTTPALPLSRPLRNLPATHWAYVVLVPKTIAVNVDVNMPTSITGLRPITSESAPHAYAEMSCPMLTAAPATPTQAPRSSSSFATP